ncbi:MAG: nickel pincer cofactor biosynthesis protein LarC [Myxococcales bacterium]|nr:nickel pincer cofactor biosynthesis protein LarC [Myxococcales bacterium]
MTLVGQHLHFDCASGIAGDMTLAAMLDLGVPRELIDAAFAAVGLGSKRLRATKITKHAMAAMQVDIDVEVPLGKGWALVGAPTSAGHGHGGPAQQPNADHEHHAYAAIAARLRGSTLTAEVKTRALDMFDRIARAEAKLHGVAIDHVAFHEVGAIDSIADVVGAATALAYLAPASVSCAVVAMGFGQVTCAHGVLPVPSPAALEILRECGGIMSDGGVARELCTPTGAAILAHAVTQGTPCPPVRPLAMGWGAGHADLADRANVVRVVVGARAELAAAATTAASSGEPQLWQIECNLDDMNPQWLPDVVAGSLALGALDAWSSAVTMKKGRPAFVLSALVPDDARAAVTSMWLRETTTLGVRHWPIARTILDRRMIEVQTAWGPVGVKVAYQGGVALKAMPEHEDCARLAAAAGVATKQVYEAALAAYLRLGP